MQSARQNRNDSKKTIKYEQWDRAFGFDPENWEFAEWYTKDTQTYYLKDCPGYQVSDPDLPF